jgi:ABC-type transporter Mla subunit MlaD
MPTAIAEYEAKVDAAFTAIGSSVDAIVTSVAGVSGDVDRLKALIAQLQASAGTVTPEDQALLDKSEAAVNGLASRVASVKDAMAALDAATEEAPTA